MDKFSKGTGQPVNRKDGMMNKHSAINVPSQSVSTATNQQQVKKGK